MTVFASVLLEITVAAKRREAMMRWKSGLLLPIVWLASGCSVDVLSCHDDLDIRTGRIRTTGYVVFMPLCSTTKDTVITKALPKAQVQDNKPEWRRINTYYWLVPVSPYHEYHNAFGAIRRFQAVTSRICFSRAALCYVASQTVKLWEECDQGSGYLATICDWAEEAEREGKRVFDVADVHAAVDLGL